jgi:hypothetical protein
MRATSLGTLELRFLAQDSPYARRLQQIEHLVCPSRGGAAHTNDAQAPLDSIEYAPWLRD